MLGWANAERQFELTYSKPNFILHRDEAQGGNLIFRRCGDGLHFYHPDQEALALVETVSDNKQHFSKRQVKAADVARDLEEKLVFPSSRDLRWAVRSNQIKDCPVTIQDLDVKETIYGKSVPALKGKTTRRTPEPVSVGNLLKVPKEFLKLHKEVYLTADIIFVNKIPFFLTTSRKLDYLWIKHLPNRTLETLFNSFKQIYVFYKKRGFRITTVSMDGEFAPLKDAIDAMPGGPTCNLTARGEHVPEVERRARQIKERVRAVMHALPFNRMPKVMTIHLVLYVVRMLGYFPTKAGVSTEYSPRQLMTGECLDYKKHLALKFGDYCQVHEEDKPRNSMKARTKGAICLGPSGNLQGGFRFMSLRSGKRITRYAWDKVPMTDTIIDRVNELGKDQPKS